MRTVITILFVLGCVVLYGQPFFNDNGKQSQGYSVLDTIIRAKGFFASTTSPYVFKRIESETDTLKAGKQKLTISEYVNFVPSDSIDYFILWNISSTSIKFTPQDGVLVTTKEAVTESGKWLPIEYWLFSTCGNSYYPLYELKKGHFLVLKTKKHQGRFQGQQRLRLKTSAGIMISEPYNGNFDEDNFSINTADKKYFIVWERLFSYLEK